MPRKEDETPLTYTELLLLPPVMAAISTEPRLSGFLIGWGVWPGVSPLYAAGGEMMSRTC